MAASSLANFFSLFIPSKAPPQSPKAALSHLSISTESSSSSGYRHGFAPMVAASNSSSSSSSSSTFPLPSCSDDLMSVVCPSLAYANTLYFSAKYNIQLEVNDNEPADRVLGRWRREVMKTGILQECKRRMFFENKQEERKRRRVDAAKRNRRRRGGPFRSDDKEEDGDDEFKKTSDDNWGLMDEDDDEDYAADTYEQVMEGFDDEDE